MSESTETLMSDEAEQTELEQAEAEEAAAFESGFSGEPAEALKEVAEEVAEEATEDAPLKPGSPEWEEAMLAKMEERFNPRMRNL